jgi:hypothetical protein
MSSIETYVNGWDCKSKHKLAIENDGDTYGNLNVKENNTFWRDI